MSTQNLPAQQGTTGALADSLEWAQEMSRGDILPPQYRGKPANILFAAEYADALGISRIHVLTSIAVINGRPSPSADLMASLVRNAGHRLRVSGDDKSFTATLVRADDPDFEYTTTWDVDKAKKAGLWGGKGPWSQYPAAMLRSRAISEVIRMAAPEVLAGGIYTPEEMGSVGADPVTATQPQTPQSAVSAGNQSAGRRALSRLKSSSTPGSPAQEHADSTPEVLEAETVDESPVEVDPAALLADLACADTVEELRRLWQETDEHHRAGRVDDDIFREAKAITKDRRMELEAGEDR